MFSPIDKFQLFHCQVYYISLTPSSQDSPSVWKKSSFIVYINSYPMSAEEISSKTYVVSVATYIFGKFIVPTYPCNTHSAISSWVDIVRTFADISNKIFADLKPLHFPIFSGVCLLARVRMSGLQGLWWHLVVSWLVFPVSSIIEFCIIGWGDMPKPREIDVYIKVEGCMRRIIVMWVLLCQVSIKVFQNKSWSYSLLCGCIKKWKSATFYLPSFLHIYLFVTCNLFESCRIYCGDVW